MELPARVHSPTFAGIFILNRPTLTLELPARVQAANSSTFHWN